jgi:hypothetical protein
MAKKTKGKLVGSVKASRGGTPYRNWMTMFSTADSMIEAGRKSGLKQYYRRPKRTKSGWILNIFQRRD